jgi:hypothetical protein
VLVSPLPLKKSWALRREIGTTEFDEHPLFVMDDAFNAEDAGDCGFDGNLELPPR